MKLHSIILGEGHPFVILHGFMGMGDNWKTLAKQFSAEGFQLHLVDQRNHGRSPHSEAFNYELMAQDLKEYCQDHKLTNIILLGHSMGGKTAMRFTSLYPEMVKKLIVADISPRFYPVHHDTILNGLSDLDFNVLKTRGEADKQLAKVITHFGTRQFLLKNLYWIEKGKLALRLNLSVLKENVGEVGEPLPNEIVIKNSTLFLRGDKSEYIGASDEALISRHFPNATITTIANAGHWLHAENPKDFFNNVLKFINQQP